MVKLRKLAGLGFGVLCLSTAMFMSSCSKEDAAAPQPKIEIAKSDASMRAQGFGVGGIETAYIANFPKTDGPTCKDCFAPGWHPKYWDEATHNTTPTGTSSLTALWGDNTKPWIKALPAPAGPGSIITATSSHLVIGQNGKVSPVVASVTNLVSDKTYEVTFQVSTTRTANSQYSKKAFFKTIAWDNSVISSDLVDLSAVPAQWVTKKIKFTAKGSKVDFQFYVTTENDLTLNYGNLYVGPNAIKQLD